MTILLRICDIETGVITSVWRNFTDHIRSRMDYKPSVTELFAYRARILREEFDARVPKSYFDGIEVSSDELYTEFLLRFS